MSHTPHELHEEFPQHQAAIHTLKMTDNHFARLADEYHDINRTIHRIEAGVEAAADERLEDLKKARLSLKDQIGAMLSKAA